MLGLVGSYVLGKEHFGGLLGFEVPDYKVFCPFLMEFKSFMRTVNTSI